MKKALLGAILLASLSFAPQGFAQQNAKSEMGEHPRIANVANDRFGSKAVIRECPITAQTVHSKIA